MEDYAFWEEGLSLGCIGPSVHGHPVSLRQPLDIEDFQGTTVTLPSMS